MRSSSSSRRRLTVAAVAAVGAFAPVASAQLMIPDSGAGDRVMLFSSQDGALIDANWITDAAGTFAFTTPKEAAVVGNQIWVSDQVADAVHRFDLNRNFLGSITQLPAGLPVSNLDNLRGFGYDGSRVYLSIMHTNSAVRGYVTIDAATATATSFTAIGTNSVFDAEPYNGDLLISNSSTNSIERRLTNGTLVSIFRNVTQPQQVATMPDGSLIVTSTIAAAGVEGLYHLNADGSLRRFIDTELLKLGAGEQVPRAGYLLDNGDYLLATSIGVFTLRPTGPGTTDYTFQTVIGGVDAQYINAVPEPGAAAALAGVAAAFIARRRR
jgi:hypothetical protein